MTSKQVVVCAAIKKADVIICGARHFDIGYTEHKWQDVPLVEENKDEPND